jgi:hypothetical protein
MVLKLCGVGDTVRKEKCLQKLIRRVIMIKVLRHITKLGNLGVILRNSESQAVVRASNCSFKEAEARGS